MDVIFFCNRDRTSSSNIPDLLVLWCPLGFSMLMV